MSACVRACVNEWAKKRMREKNPFLSADCQRTIGPTPQVFGDQRLGADKSEETGPVGVGVAPSLFVAGSDSKHFLDIVDQVSQFASDCFPLHRSRCRFIRNIQGVEMVACALSGSAGMILVFFR